MIWLAAFLVIIILTGSAGMAIGFRLGYDKSTLDAINEYRQGRIDQANVDAVVLAMVKRD